MLKRFFGRQEGQGMAEYGLILALVSIAAIIALAVLGPRLQTIFTNIANHL